jgi:SRSO17 transposase
VLGKVRELVLPAIERHGPIEAWIIDDTGFPKKGRHSVGVARQYCGQVGKQDNCQVAVSLSLANRHASLPVAWRLYLPKEWAADEERRRKAGVPEEVDFATKPQIALEQLREACAAGLPRGVVLMDPGYGHDGQLRAAVTALGLAYVAGIQSNSTVWPSGSEPRHGDRAPTTGRRDEPDLVWSRRWRWACRTRLGAGSSGGKVPPTGCRRALRACACASAIVTAGPTIAHRSGC